MDMSQFRKSDRESSQHMGLMGFQLLLASASARQAASATTRALVRQAYDTPIGMEPDHLRIALLSNRAQQLFGQKNRMARFSDLNLPTGYAGEMSAFETS